jgi:membrane associated rhomboid family serine protease
LLPLKDNLGSVRFPLVTISLIVATVALEVAGWDPNLTDTWWPFAAVASLFVTGGFWALVVNMVFLWLFAKSLEDTLGSVRFLALFLVAGIGAAAAQELFDPDTVVPSVGVAGAIAGLIGAYALLWFALQALDAVGQPPLSGLIGGLIVGAVAVRLLAHGRPRITPEVSQPVY